MFTKGGITTTDISLVHSCRFTGTWSGARNRGCEDDDIILSAIPESLW